MLEGKEEALQYIKYWKKNLGLSNWEFQVTIDYCGETSGKIVFNSHTHRAIIYLNPKVDSWLNKDGEDELEFVVVHELLHIVLSKVLNDRCAEDELYFEIKEETINTLASALIREKYFGDELYEG